MILFIFSYTILAMLVVEQGRTIETQRGLLREMLKDSTQLASLKSKLARDDAERAGTKTTTPPQTNDSSRGSRDRNSGNAATTTPKASGNGEAKRPGKSARTMREVPEKPAADLQDVRRSTHEI